MSRPANSDGAEIRSTPQWFATTHWSGKGSERKGVIHYDPFMVVGQTQPVWQANYTGLNAGTHRGNAIGLDAAGNVYVAGQSAGSGTVATRRTGSPSSIRPLVRRNG